MFVEEFKNQKNTNPVFETLKQKIYLPSQYDIQPNDWNLSLDCKAESFLKKQSKLLSAPTSSSKKSATKKKKRNKNKITNATFKQPPLTSPRNKKFLLECMHLEQNKNIMIHVAKVGSLISKYRWKKNPQDLLLFVTKVINLLDEEKNFPETIKHNMFFCAKQILQIILSLRSP